MNELKTEASKGGGEISLLGSFWYKVGAVDEGQVGEWEKWETGSQHENGDGYKEAEMISLPFPSSLNPF